MDSRSFKVIEFCEQSKGHMDFLSVVNSNLGRILHGFGAMVTYWSKSRLCNVFVLFNALARVIPWEYVDEPYMPKTRYTALSASEDSIILRSFFWTQITTRRVTTDGQTDRQDCYN